MLTMTVHDCGHVCFAERKARHSCAASAINPRVIATGIRIIRGKIDNRTIEVLHTGVGEKTCRQRMASFLQDRQFDCLVSAGFAGALNDKLRAGDLLFAENFSTIQLNEIRSGGSSPIHRGESFDGAVDNRFH